MKPIHVQLSHKAGELSNRLEECALRESFVAHVVVFEVGPQNAPTELTNAGDDKTGKYVRG